MNSIKECFDTILHGNKDASRSAARQVRKLLYSSQGEHDKYNDIKDVVSDASNTYLLITEDWRQENFVLAISVIYFLHDKDAEPDFLFSWFFQLLQHQNGYIRHAAVKMISNELGPLTVHIRCPGHEPGYFGKLKPEQADNILRSLSRYLQMMLADLWEPKFKKYKYIESLPASPYKSVQMVLAEIEEDAGKDYIT